jgi:hypothetical protein
MGIREVLQTEIWSKETSRKILARMWKIFVGLEYVGIGLGVVLAGVVLWFVVSTHWLTERERAKGKIALVQVDALQNFDGVNDSDFNVRSQQAQEKVDDALNAAFTVKDRVTAFYLDYYLHEVDSMRRHEMWQKRMKSLPTDRRQERSQELEFKEEELERESVQMFRGLSHKLLDK